MTKPGARRRVISEHDRFHGLADVETWSRTVEPGTIASAAALLPSFLASLREPPQPPWAPWSPALLGKLLARISCRIVEGRSVERLRGPNGTHLYRFDVWPRPEPHSRGGQRLYVAPLAASDVPPPGRYVYRAP